MYKRTQYAFLVGVALLSQVACTRSASDYLARGNKFFETRKYEDAEIQYRKALQKDPNFGEAYYRIGWTKMEQNRGGEAYEPLFRAVQLMPDSDAAKVKLADVSLALYVVLPQHPRALYDQIGKLADQLLAKNRDSYDGLRLKGSLRLLDRNPKEAIVLFERANQIEAVRPDLVQAWVQALFQDNRIAEGERLAEQLIQKDKSFGPIYDVLYTQYASSNRSADAENILKTKIANNPKDASDLLQLARHYAAAKNSAEVNRTLQRLTSDPKDFPSARLQAGEFYAGLSEWDQAVAQFEEGARANPKEKLAYQKRLTDALLAQGKRTEAAQTVELILKDQPKDDDARRIRATLLLETGKPENIATAVVELQPLVKERPDDGRLRFVLGRAYVAQGNLDAAKPEFQHVIRLRNEEVPSRLALAAIGINQRKPDEALRYIGEILTQDPENDAARILRATALIGAGSYAEARAELTRLLHQNPKSWDIQFEFGMLAIAEKKFIEAERVFRVLYQPGQVDPRAAEGLVETYSASNRLDRAIQLLGDDLKKSPGSVSIRRLLAVTQARAGKYDLATSEYQRVLEEDPKSVDVRMQAAQVYRLKGDLTNAIAVLEPAAALAPTNPEPIMLLAALHEQAGHTAEARTGYQRVLQLRPDNPFVLNNIAFLLAETDGNLDEALGLAERALQKSPGHPVLTDTLGYIYLKKKQNDSALRTFNGLVRQYPNSPTYHLHLGMALLESGEKLKAKSEFETALANQPSPEDAAKLKELLSNIRG